MMNTKPMSCSFCLNLGIAEPHDHTIRDFGNKDKSIMCPKLLSIECCYCHLIGHTKIQCPKLRERNSLKSRKVAYPVVHKSSDKKRAFIVDSDGFSQVPSNNYSRVTEQKKVQKIGILMSAFGALDVEGDSDAECDSDVDAHADIDADIDAHVDAEEKKENGASMILGQDDKPSWAKIVSTKNKETVFATQQELRDRIGIKLGSRWADCDEDDGDDEAEDEW